MLYSGNVSSSPDPEDQAKPRLYLSPHLALPLLLSDCLPSLPYQGSPRSIPLISQVQALLLGKWAYAAFRLRLVPGLEFFLARVPGPLPNCAPSLDSVCAEPSLTVKGKRGAVLDVRRAAVLC